MEEEAEKLASSTRIPSPVTKKPYWLSFRISPAKKSPAGKLQLGNIAKAAL